MSRDMAIIKNGNMYSKLPLAKHREVFQSLSRKRNMRIERIVSHGQATKPGMWLQERWDEWVLVLKGAGNVRRIPLG